MCPTRLLVLTVLPCALLLTGCGQGAVPDALLAPYPCPMAPAVVSDRALAGYILQLDGCARARGDQIRAIAEVVR
jgi:hypothetical protein